ncbi:MAG TPA: polysaccharide deacetylase family protein [Solirubrobacterales bacterium]
MTPGPNKIERAAWALSRTGAGMALRRLPTWDGVLTLCFHRIGAREGSAWERTIWDTTLEELDRRLRFLRRHAQVIAPEEMLGMEAAPRGPHVLLTFDDGYREWATEVLPLLRAHGVRAAFFLATGFIDEPRAPWWYELPWMARSAGVEELPAGGWLDEPLRLDGDRDAAADALLDAYKELPGERCEAFLEWVAEASGSGRCDAGVVREDWLTWDMARELRDAGMEIGGHTVDHPVLARLPAAAQREQISACARRIEAELGREMRMFAYPVGIPDSFDEQTKAALREEGVQLAFGYHGGYARADRPLDRLDVPRVTGGMEPQILGATLALPQVFARW